MPSELVSLNVLLVHDIELVVLVQHVLGEPIVTHVLVVVLLLSQGVLHL